MSPPIRSLVFKEVHERRLQFALATLWILLGAIHSVVYEMGHRFHAVVANYSGVLAGFEVAAILVAMRTALGEITDRTRSFADGVPVSPRVRGWVRLAGGWGVLIAPMLIGGLIIAACLAGGWGQQAPLRAMDIEAPYVRMPERGVLAPLPAIGLLGEVLAIRIASVSMLYLLATTLGTFVRSEARAGYAGAVLMVAWFLLTALRPEFGRHLPLRLTEIVMAVLPVTRIIHYGYGEVGGGSYSDLDLGTGIVWTLAANAGVQVLLAIWAVRRYAAIRPLTREGEASRPDRARRVWLPRLGPLPLPTLSLAWLAGRHALPMALPGLLFAAGLASITFVQPHMLFRDNLSQTSWAMGALWSVVVGAGLFAGDVDPRIGEFWRTRPIAPWKLFAVKFLTGLFVTLLVLDGPSIALAWNSPNWGNYYSMNWPHIAVMVPFHGMMFSLAVALTCLIRQPLAAGLLTFVAFTLQSALSSVLPALDPIEVYNSSRFSDRNPSEFSWVSLLPPSYPELMWFVGSVYVLSLLTGYWALTRYRPLPMLKK